MAKTELAKDAREKRNEYYRKWRAQNKDKVKESNRRYWEKKAKEGKLRDNER